MEEVKMGPRFEKIICTTMSPSETTKRLCQLEQVLLKRMPQSTQLLVICRLGIQQRYPKNTLIQFYRYLETENSDWPNDMRDEEEPFIVCIQRPCIFSKKGIILVTPEKLTSEMITTFDSFIGWDSHQVFAAVQEPFSTVLRKMCKKHGELNPFPEGMPCNFMSILDVEKAKNLQVPYELLAKNNLKIRELELKDVPETVSNWPKAMDHSKKEIEENVKTLFSCGIFTEEDEMATSVMHTTLGLFNGLFTPDKFRRKGYGQILMIWLSKKAAQELGTPSIAEAETWNIASKKLLEKVGYERLYETLWLYYNPPAAALP